MSKRGFYLACFVFLLIALSASAYAKMECNIMPAAQCRGNVVLRMSSLQEGGSHAGLLDSSRFAMSVCCSGIKGLAVSGTGKPIVWLNAKDDAHAGRIQTSNGIYLTADEEIGCGYETDCASYDACLFTISGDNDAHISGCKDNQYPFRTKLCCRQGKRILAGREAFDNIEIEKSGPVPETDIIAEEKEPSIEQPAKRSKFFLPEKIKMLLNEFKRRR